MIHNLVECRLLSQKPIPSRNPEENPARKKKKKQRQRTEFLLLCKIPSLGNHRQLLCGHLGGLACFWVLSSFRLFPWKPCVGPAQPLAARLPGPTSPTSTLASTFVRWASQPIPFFPWDTLDSHVGQTRCFS